MSNFVQIFIFFTLKILSSCNRAQKILVVGDNTFNKTIDEYFPSIVEFTADPCGHCWELDGIFREIWRKNKEMVLPISFIKTNITRNIKLRERFNITEFPTLKFFKNNSYYEDYPYSQTEKEIINWLKKKLNPKVTELSNLIKVQTTVKKVENILLYYGNKSDTVYQIFSKISEDFINIEFISCDSVEVGSHYNINRGNFILFKGFSNKEIVLKDRVRNSQQFIKLIRSKFLENLRKFDSETNKLVFNEGSPGVFLFRNEKHPDTRELDILLEEIAYKMKVQIL